MTPESIPEEVPPPIWGTWVTGDVPSLDMPDAFSGIDWVCRAATFDLN